MVSEAYKAEAFDRIIAAFRSGTDRGCSVYVLVETESDKLRELEQHLAPLGAVDDRPPCFKCGERAATDCPDCKRSLCEHCVAALHAVGEVSCCITESLVSTDTLSRKDLSP